MIERRYHVWSSFWPFSVGPSSVYVHFPKRIMYCSKWAIYLTVSVLFKLLSIRCQYNSIVYMPTHTYAHTHRPMYFNRSNGKPQTHGYLYGIQHNTRTWNSNSSGETSSGDTIHTLWMYRCIEHAKRHKMRRTVRIRSQWVRSHYFQFITIGN